MLGRSSSSFTSSSSGFRTCFLFAGCWSACSPQRRRRPLLSFLGCHNQSRPLPAAHMLGSSQVRSRGSPHLNCDPFSPGREGFLAGLPDTVQTAQPTQLSAGLRDGLGAPPLAPAPAHGLNLSHHSAPDSAGGGGRRNFPAPIARRSSEMLPGSSRREQWLLLPLVSVPEIYTTASRCSRQSCTPRSGCSDVF